LLYDQQRHTKYPLFQHYNPTHIISPNHISLIHQLQPFFQPRIHPFKIHPLLQSQHYINLLTHQYTQPIHLYNQHPQPCRHEKFILVHP
ncbi:U32 family peptidase, partial [Staphylococcus capitis]|uniref:U32 family peptidase n=1 Tax=Staphylococcus capitis TaxID=29388 RepID=UPI001642ABFD